MNQRKALNQIRKRRTARSRAKISGTASKPRLALKRSNRYFYAQLINDEMGKTLTSAWTGELEESQKKKTKTEQASLIGQLLAAKARVLGIKKAVLDRRSNRYHGRVAAFAEGARKSGLEI